MVCRLTCQWNGRIVIVDFVVLFGRSEPEHAGSVGRDRAVVSSWPPISWAIAVAITSGGESHARCPPVGPDVRALCVEVRVEHPHLRDLVHG